MIVNASSNETVSQLRAIVSMIKERNIKVGLLTFIGSINLPQDIVIQIKELGISFTYNEECPTITTLPTKVGEKIEGQLYIDSDGNVLSDPTANKLIGNIRANDLPNMLENMTLEKTVIKQK